MNVSATQAPIHNGCTMEPMMKCRCLTIHEYGDRNRVVKLEETDLPDLLPNQVLIKTLAAPINPADLNIIEGKYPLDHPLPIALGMEGVGAIVETGHDVSADLVGRHVIVLKRPGSWCEFRVADQHDIVPVPHELPVDQASMILVNPPTAWRMLHDFIDLKPGDWIAQNAANSGVGQYVIHMANALGVKTVNVVRREESIQALLDIGADVVLVDHPKLSKLIHAKIGASQIRLAFNAVGGKSATELAKALNHGGILVTYGAMSMEPVSIPNGLLIFNDIQVRGFWLKYVYQRTDRQTIIRMFDDIIRLIQERSIHIPIEKQYRLEQFQSALEHAGQPSRSGKILFTFQ